MNRLCHYTKDYLGNNRTVINGTTGEIEQSVAYYPFGGVIADLGFGHGEQQYKFGGKELDMANGLNEYDFGARRYYHGVPMFSQPDKKEEKYCWLSPYIFCSNDPVKTIKTLTYKKQAWFLNCYKKVVNLQNERSGSKCGPGFICSQRHRKRETT